VRILPSASVARLISPERPEVLAATASVKVFERPMLTPLLSTLTETSAGSEALKVITPSFPAAEAVVSPALMLVKYFKPSTVPCKAANASLTSP
jgi:hypothetical protein